MVSTLGLGLAHFELILDHSDVVAISRNVVAILKIATKNRHYKILKVVEYCSIIIKLSQLEPIVEFLCVCGEYYH